MEDKNAITFAIIMLLVALVIISSFALILEVKVKELRLELKRVNLDRGGLNGLCKALIKQKYDKPYNTIDYGVNLPDGTTVAVKVNYPKDYILSPIRRYELVRIHKEAIAEITQEEWIKWGNNNPPE